MDATSGVPKKLLEIIVFVQIKLIRYNVYINYVAVSTRLWSLSVFIAKPALLL